VSDRAADGVVSKYLPHVLYPQAATTPLHAYSHGPFCRFRISASLTAEGVYIISRDEKPLYVGTRYTRGHRPTHFQVSTRFNSAMIHGDQSAVNIPSSAAF